jgi:uncharacterized protein (DUF2147 family)
MIKKLYLFVFIATLAIHSNAQEADQILGKWASASGEGHIEIYNRGSKYFGKLVWIKKPKDEKGALRLDVNNPLEELRRKPIVGLEILKDFSYNNKKWEDGTIYDPKSGKTYSCKMTIPDPNHLNIRGYIGISLIGKTEVWSKVNQ